MTTITKHHRNPFKDLNTENLSAGLLAAIFGCVATSLIIVNSGAQAGLTDVQISNWLTACWTFGGALGLFMAWRTGQPISGAWSIPAAVMLGGALDQFTFQEAVGAYFLAGVLVFLLGVTGLVTRLIRWIPMPIIMAMIAGALMRFATGILDGIEALPWIAGATVATYFIAQAMTRRVTPIIPALLVGLALFLLFGESSLSQAINGYIMPRLYMPDFSLSAFIAISLPVAILVVGAENAQATGVLLSEGYPAPVRNMTVISGIGGMAASFFGAHNSNIAGPMTAICSSDAAGPDKSKRYVASLICGVICLLFGVFSSYAIQFIQLVPVALVATVAGLAMINVLLQALQMAFNPKGTDKGFQLGAFVAFVIALSGVSVLNITAPFWALVGGLLVTLVTGREAFKHAGRDNGALA